jgi:hypothetical protein
MHAGESRVAFKLSAARHRRIFSATLYLWSTLVAQAQQPSGLSYSYAQRRGGRGTTLKSGSCALGLV